MRTVLHGKHFVIGDELGDIDGRARGAGAYHRDMRYLSRWHLRVAGAPLIASRASRGTHRLRHVEATADAGQLVVERERLVTGPELLERVRISSVAEVDLEFDVELEVAADFRDIFVVKREVFDVVGHEVGDVGPTNAPEGDEVVPSPCHELARRTRMRRDGSATLLDATVPFVVSDDSTLRWHAVLEPGGRWECVLRVGLETTPAAGDVDPIDFDVAAARATVDLERWLGDAPRLEGGRDEGLRRTWDTSLRDLAALRIPVGAVDDDPRAMLPAAGLPWFMATFGRDTLITCLQTMVLGADRARVALEYLADRQAVVDDPDADAEPGKILHEIREGAIADRGYGIYYGTIDATPLWLVLLDEYHRWTRDTAFVERMRPHALAALAWVRTHGTSGDGTGFLRYERRSPRGLEHQSWKDSTDSQRFHDGRWCAGAIAPVEAQGYAYDARLRTARLARAVWDDPALAAELEEEATTFSRRFHDAFWIVERDHHALALDGESRAADSLTSNVGHLLWSGIVPEVGVERVVERLTHPALFSGWGIRTMSTLGHAYDPLAYHNGSVWPHDTSICVAGLARAGAWDAAERIARAMLDAADAFDGRLPEVFAGLPRERAEAPVEYPTASSPQAWAAAAPIFLVATVLGIEPHPTEPRLVARRKGVPAWLEGVALRGITACGGTWDIEVRDGAAVVSPSS